MKAIVISYSLTGNNEAVSARVAEVLAAKHVKVKESKPRSNGTIILDILFNRTPAIHPMIDNVEDYDLVIFMGPVWMGQIATPLRGYFKQLREKIKNYAFISVSGGSDGDNPRLGDELFKRLGKKPLKLIDLHIADLLPKSPRPIRKDTSDYRLTENDVKNLSTRIVELLPGMVTV
jgi:flavodoxin